MEMDLGERAKAKLSLSDPPSAWKYSVHLYEKKKNNNLNDHFEVKLRKSEKTLTTVNYFK